MSKLNILYGLWCCFICKIMFTNMLFCCVHCSIITYSQSFSFISFPISQLGLGLFIVVLTRTTRFTK